MFEKILWVGNPLQVRKPIMAWIHKYNGIYLEYKAFQ